VITCCIILDASYLGDHHLATPTCASAFPGSLHVLSLPTTCISCGCLCPMPAMSSMRISAKVTEWRKCSTRTYLLASCHTQGSSQPSSRWWAIETCGPRNLWPCSAELEAGLWGHSEEVDCRVTKGHDTISCPNYICRNYICRNTLTTPPAYAPSLKLLCPTSTTTPLPGCTTRGGSFCLRCGILQGAWQATLLSSTSRVWRWFG